MSTKVAFDFYPGLPFEREFQAKDSDGNPVDLTGCSMRMHVRDRAESSSILIALTTENQRLLITSPSAGIYRLKLIAGETNEIKRSGVSDLEITFPDGTIVPKVIECEFNRVLTVTR